MIFQCCKWRRLLVGSLLATLTILWVLEPPGLAQSQKSPPARQEPRWPKSSEAAGAANWEQFSQNPVGAISGTIADETGALIEGAQVRLSSEGHPDQEKLSDHEGAFSFSGVVAGPFELEVTFGGFTTHLESGVLHPGENYDLPRVTLVIAAMSTNIQVAMSRTEIAEAELKDQEKQRVLGALPNFYVAYDPVAPPLTARQKFKLAWKATIDPVNLIVAAGIAGMGQTTNSFAKYGQGAQGYAKRFGAAYTDSVAGTFLGDAILPSVLKQDPRYFYKGTGTIRSRFFYALSRAVVCKNDNGQTQANYSAMVGGFAAAGISNLYYPSHLNRGVSTVESALVGIGTSAVTNVLQEFIFRKLTPHAPNYTAAP